EKSSRKPAEAATTGIDGAARQLRLRGLPAALAFFACALPVALGCLVPLYRLAQFAWEVGDPLWGERFIDYTLNSLQVAFLAALLAVLTAVQLNTTRRLAANRATRLATGLATLGYALPGTMLAVGLLAPLSQVDRQLTEFSEDYFGWSGGLILSGTIALLIYAYITRFLTVAFNTTSSGMTQIPSSYYEAARTLGAAPWRVIQKIQLPLLRRSIVTALLLVFVDTMRELPATLLLRPFNFETLATRVYRLAGDERLAEASSAALCIVALGLIPVLLVTRQNRHANGDQ
ncbi:MAG: ABC transporter permease subunit, partial [Polyangiaceae bacterium]|nr:ABC transporter permease subunit [Polyangiaceae bacterium]